MKELKVAVLTDLSIIDLHHLVEESKEEGFRFLDRMIAEYTTGENRFDRHGEILLGIYEKERSSRLEA
ncbi:hypothetical protein [Bacillus sp. Marseille-Q1617]|uniref:hypothetical protein n=1 Tax=Bacillus sp. Marseille-Q1617 TaxID=2736887 RepID=UPI0020CA4CE2|nr:hypothetical protein [Bacillus sp. Marseille-Q1617]